MLVNLDIPATFMVAERILISIPRRISIKKPCCKSCLIPLNSVCGISALSPSAAQSFAQGSGVIYAVTTHATSFDFYLFRPTCFKPREADLKCRIRLLCSLT